MIKIAYYAYVLGLGALAVLSLMETWGARPEGAAAVGSLVQLGEDGALSIGSIGDAVGNATVFTAGLFALILLLCCLMGPTKLALSMGGTLLAGTNMLVMLSLNAGRYGLVVSVLIVLMGLALLTLGVVGLVTARLGKEATL